MFIIGIRNPLFQSSLAIESIGSRNLGVGHEPIFSVIQIDIKGRTTNYSFHIENTSDFDGRWIYLGWIFWIDLMTLVENYVQIGGKGAKNTFVNYREKAKNNN